MKSITARSIALVLLMTFAASATNAQAVNRQKLATEVRAEFLHAWQGYKKYAWGHDDLKPLSKTYHDWYAEPLLMTPVDALDTMILMGMRDEAKTTREYIATHLSFNKDIEVQNFEIYDSAARRIALEL
jgi:Glycosyl hydrolase family 47